MATVMAAGLPAMTALLGAAVGLVGVTARRIAGLGIIILGSVMLAWVTSGAWEGAWRGER